MNELLRRRGITHAEIADRAGQERSYVTRQVRGQRHLTPECAAAISTLVREADRRRLREAAEILEREGRPLAAQEVQATAAAV